MSRTPEQKTADELLTKAVDTACRAYGFSAPGTINVQYMVLVEQRIWVDEDSPSTAIVRLYKDGDMPWISIIGLLRASTLRSEAEYLEGELP
jgi:hypothetical protein